MFTGLLVNLYTRDIEAAIRFYRDVVGLRETFRTPKEGVPEHVEFDVNGARIGLGTVEAAERVHRVSPQPGAPSMSLVLWCDDVDAIHAKLVAAGAVERQPPHDSGNGNRNSLFADPDGNLVEFVSKV